MAANPVAIARMPVVQHVEALLTRFIVARCSATRGNGLHRTRDKPGSAAFLRFELGAIVSRLEDIEARIAAGRRGGPGALFGQRGLLPLGSVIRHPEARLRGDRLRRHSPPLGRRSPGSPCSSPPALHRFPEVADRGEQRPRAPDPGGDSRHSPSVTPVLGATLNRERG